MYCTEPAFIEYTSNHEFRAAFRRHMGMDESKLRANLITEFGESAVNEMDEETLDELLLDHDRMSAVMNDVLAKTKKNIQFILLYKLGAAKWISEDIGIGQCILFTYDYYYLYHSCLYVYLNHPEQWGEKCPYFIQLRDKLQER